MIHLSAREIMHDTIVDDAHVFGFWLRFSRHGCIVCVAVCVFGVIRNSHVAYVYMVPISCNIHRNHLLRKNIGIYRIRWLQHSGIPYMVIFHSIVALWAGASAAHVDHAIAAIPVSSS